MRDLILQCAGVAAIVVASWALLRRNGLRLARR